MRPQRQSKINKISWQFVPPNILYIIRLSSTDTHTHKKRRLHDTPFCSYRRKTWLLIFRLLSLSFLMSSSLSYSSEKTLFRLDCTKLSVSVLIFLPLSDDFFCLRFATFPFSPHSFARWLYYLTQPKTWWLRERQAVILFTNGELIVSDCQTQSVLPLTQCFRCIFSRSNSWANYYVLNIENSDTIHLKLGAICL